MNTKLKAGGLQLIGITTGATPHAVYYAPNGAFLSVEAVPVAGGAPVVLEPIIADADYVFVSGGAVAWYVGTDADGPTGLATGINVWTKAAGKKTVTTATRSSLFAATEDGASVAFSTGATATATDIAVTTAAIPAATATLTSTNTVNFAAFANDCPAQIGFTGTTLVAAYCTGVDPAAVDAQLVTVAAGAAAVVRIPNTVSANAIQPHWFADTSGTKLFVAGPKPTNEARIVVTNALNTTVTPVAGAVDPAAGVIANVAKDGTFATYISAGALKKTTFASPPIVTTVVAAAVKGYLSVTKDSKRVLYYTAIDGPTTDAQSVDVSAAVPAPVAIVATPTAYVNGFTGTGAYVVYTDAVVAATGDGKLQSKPAAGGAAKLLDAKSFNAFTAPEGDGVLSVTARTDSGDGKTFLMNLKYADSGLGGALRNGTADAVETQGSFAFSGKSFLYTNISAAAPGLYTMALP